MPSPLDTIFGLPGITITDAQETDDSWTLYAKPDYDITCPYCGSDRIAKSGPYGFRNSEAKQFPVITG